MRDQLLLDRAKTMRRGQTGPEQMLWLSLRAKRFENAKFRRQVVIGRYIVDFACRHPIKLVIEIDGDTHAAQRAYDAARTGNLCERGYRVLRFTNDDVMTNLDGVLLTIQQALPTPPLPTSSGCISPRDIQVVPGARPTPNSPEGEREKGC